MTQSAMILRRSALEALLAPAATATAEPVWRLLLTALFAATAALCFAAVVIFGAPGAASLGPSAEPVQVTVNAPAT